MAADAAKAAAPTAAPTIHTCLTSLHVTIPCSDIDSYWKASDPIRSHGLIVTLVQLVVPLEKQTKEKTLRK